MNGLKYQLISMARDKMCIMTFLLPILAGLAIHLLSGADLVSVTENSFGILTDDLSAETIRWMQNYGEVSFYENVEELEMAVMNPSTQKIGVLGSGDGIRTIRAGDELQLYTVIGDTLPQLYEKRCEVSAYDKMVIPRKSNNDGMKSLLSVITMVTAMFMGCTFNAMNIIGEKEDGIGFINDVLPMTTFQYLTQKMTLGFLGGILSAAATALVCFGLVDVQVIPLVLLILMSAFIAALAGLFIGQFSGGLMTGIVYIKIVMITFLAPPIFFYIAIPHDSAGHLLSLLLPSAPAFYGLMGMLSGQTRQIGIYLAALAGHSTVWVLLFYLLRFRSQVSGIRKL